MSEVTVGVIQHQISIFDTPFDYQADIFRFFELAQANQVQLVVLPALSPLMMIPPLASRSKLEQLKKEQERAGKTGLVGRLFNKESAAGQAEGQGIQDDLVALLAQYPAELFEAYIDLFSAAALKYQMSIVAGSFYLREDEAAECSHVCYVFGPNGMVLGRQEKLSLTKQEREFCQPGRTLQTIETPVGKVGLLIEEDVLYPEYGRLLAYDGAEILISLVAGSSRANTNRIRNIFLTRVDENGLFGLQSCLVGRDLLNPLADPLLGQSVILQPYQMSDRGDGVVTQVNSLDDGGLTTAKLNLDTLKDHWVQTYPRLRRRLNLPAVQPLANKYHHQRTIEQAYWNPISDEG